MPPSAPFFDRGTGTIDTTQLLVEAAPLAKLIGLFAAIALVPFAIAFLLGGYSIVGVLFTLVGQFILAVGSGIVLLYVVSRGMQLSRE
ncbi:hypothetical protein SAMN05421858_4172 [Haladaptatus litoreus]|uniref:Uncharacterized protein n=1 Tax=Haladaptatus litoreus TaxID=553468 RepID=A0A1N7EAS7_9EURY|nr:hypothetical protein [Haladaptatus litoreus]SIR85129.1 hypothetical protein SAMN05421858_4172 [Haladaptatus litoreus]